MLNTLFFGTPFFRQLQYTKRRALSFNQHGNSPVLQIMPESDLLYAELLSNIRQISVIAFLKSPITHETLLKLSEDGQSVILIHNGSTQKLNLPAFVAVNPQLLKQRSANIGSKEISWRLPLLDQSPQKKDEDFSQAAIAPWAATNLPDPTKLLCRECQAVIVASSALNIWKDLPSENWAEMMDFWHCHKPTDNEDEKAGHRHEDDASHQKAYGAHTKFIAETGVGFVGLTYFLLSEKDCQNIVVSAISIVFFQVGHQEGGRARVYTLLVAWLPIQMPKNNTKSYHLLRQQLVLSTLSSRDGLLD